jgi:hypothetical protein
MLYVWCGQNMYFLLTLSLNWVAISVNPRAIVDAQQAHRAAWRPVDLAGNQLGFDENSLSQQVRPPRPAH